MAADGVRPERVYLEHKSGPAGRKERKPAGPCHIDLPVLTQGIAATSFLGIGGERPRVFVFAAAFWLPAATIIAVWRGHRKSMPAKDCLQCPGYPFPYAVAGGWGGAATRYKVLDTLHR